MISLAILLLKGIWLSQLLAVTNKASTNIGFAGLLAGQGWHQRATGLGLARKLAGWVSTSVCLPQRTEAHPSAFLQLPLLIELNNVSTGKEGMIQGTVSGLQNEALKSAFGTERL